MDLFVKELGNSQAPPVVLLHGGGVAGWMWEKQVASFMDYHLLIPDLPGHGNSAQIPFVSMNDAASKVLTAVGDIVGEEKFTVIGFSLGAQLVVEILSKWPEKVDSAIVLSALVKPYAKGKNFLLSTLKMSFGLIKNKSFSKLQAKQLYIGKDKWETYYEDSLKMTKSNFINMMEANLSYSLPSSFAASDVRALVLVGMNELERMKDSAREMVKANRNCIGYLVSGAGHGLSLAAPELFNEIVLNYINNIQLHKNDKLDRII